MDNRPARLKNRILALMRQRVPGQVVIQLTDRCNATCPQCGMRKTERFRRSPLDGDSVRRIIDAAAAKGVEALSFTGGEPMLLRSELADHIRYAGRAGIPYIRTGTNGFFFADTDLHDFEDRIRAIADHLADTPLRNFWISLDSALPHVHETMRGLRGVVSGIARALPVFHDRGLFPSVNLGINRNISAETMKTRAAAAGRLDEAATFYRRFQSGFRAFYRQVIDLGFTIVNSCYPMSVTGGDESLDAVYAASASDPVVSFTAGEKALIYKALMDTIPEFRSRIRIFSPRASLNALMHQHDGNGNGSRPYPCRGGIDFFFIDARDGDTYPCGYRGHQNLGKFWDLDIHRIPESPECRACDWECFRDPSELFGPILECTSAPFALADRLRGNPRFFQLWLADLWYYQACDFFDGRRPPDPRRLARFGSQTTSANP